MPVESYEVIRELARKHEVEITRRLSDRLGRVVLITPQGWIFNKGRGRNSAGNGELVAYPSKDYSPQSEYEHARRYIQKHFYLECVEDGCIVMRKWKGDVTIRYELVHRQTPGFEKTITSSLEPLDVIYTAIDTDVPLDSLFVCIHWNLDGGSHEAPPYTYTEDIKVFVSKFVSTGRWLRDDELRS